MDMDSSVVISKEVIRRVKFLPDCDRKAIANALVDEILFGISPEESLSPFQIMLYSIVQHYIRRDTARFASI